MPRDAVGHGNYPYELLVTPLMERGVAFRACRNAIKARLLKPEQLLEGVEVVPAGLAEAARPQVREGYANSKP
jgi:intracellular sulfur oxidation DsrE/DsrF family protein